MYAQYEHDQFPPSEEIPPTKKEIHEDDFTEDDVPEEDDSEDGDVPDVAPTAEDEEKEF